MGLSLRLIEPSWSVRPVLERGTSFLISHACNVMAEWCFTREKTRAFDMSDDALNDIENSYLSKNRVKTHWDGCVATHIECAIAYLVKRAKSAEARVGKLENAISAHQIEIGRLRTSIRNTVLQMVAKTEVAPDEWLEWGKLVLGEDLSNE